MVVCHRQCMTKGVGSFSACMPNWERFPYIRRWYLSVCFDSFHWWEWTSRCNERSLDILGREIRVYIEEICSSNITSYNKKRLESMYYLSKYLPDVHEDASITSTQDKENTMFEEVLVAKGHHSDIHMNSGRTSQHLL